MQDPIWEIMAREGRRYDWLAGRTGYTPETISRMRYGKHRPSPTFRRRAAEALARPESELFLTQGTAAGGAGNPESENVNQSLIGAGER